MKPPLTDDPSAYATWSDIPLSLLRHELARRADTDEQPERPACGSSKSNHHYNTALHVFALFLILILSTFACSFPIVAKRFPHLPIPNRAIFISRHFGTGVLIATAFVHLLPTAYTSLTDPCLPEFWNDVYPAMTGFIAMLSVLVVVAVEMFFASKGAAHDHSGGEFGRLKGEDDGEMGGGNRLQRPGHERTPSFLNKPFRPVDIAVGRQESVEMHAGLAMPSSNFYTDSPPNTARSLNKPLPPEPPPPPPGEDSEDDEDLDLNTDELDPLTESSTEALNGYANGHSSTPGKMRRQVSFADSPTYASPPPSPSPNSPNERRLVLQCLLLEAGILFHSVFIGMALSVSTGPAFVVLLIAISFHQTFEGLALGSRIASINTFSPTSPKPWLMSFMYGVTTPIGQAVGLAVHGLYDPASQMGLLMVGIVNAISSGLLLYAGLVQLLAEDFLSDKSYVDLKGRRRLEACAAVVGGSMLMALVGAWA